ncbi:MAG: hypothetical protein ACI4WS_13215, partial [Oscillospiraceae bacterium]
MAVPVQEKENIKEQEQPSLLAEGGAEAQPVQFTGEYTESQNAPQPAPGAEDAQQFMEQATLQQEEMTRRDREILAALDEVLQKNSAQNREPKAASRRRFDFSSLAVCTVKNGSGVLSLALTLIFMGIVLVCVMFSSQPDYLVIAKLSPISAVILGAELLLSWFVNGRQLRINLPCICIIAAIVAGCCVMSAALNSSERQMNLGRGSRVVEAEIYEASYKKLRHSADVMELTITADLLPGSEKKTMDTLEPGDMVEITAVLDGNYADQREFAAECSRIIDVYKDMDIPVSDYHFIAETRLSSFRLDVEGLFQQEKSVEELSSLVRYIYVE